MQKFYVNEYGFLKAEFEKPLESLGWFFESDIGKSVKGCEIYIEKCEEVLNGKIPQWEATGNAYTLSVSKNRALLENEFSESEPSCEFPTKVLITELKRWKSFIQTL